MRFCAREGKAGFAAHCSIYRAAPLQPAALSRTSSSAFMLGAKRAQDAAARSAGSLLTFSIRPRSEGELAARAVKRPLAQINAQNILHR